MCAAKLTSSGSKSTPWKPACSVFETSRLSLKCPCVRLPLSSQPLPEKSSKVAGPSLTDLLVEVEEAKKCAPSPSVRLYIPDFTIAGFEGLKHLELFHLLVIASFPFLVPPLRSAVQDICARPRSSQDGVLAANMCGLRSYLHNVIHRQFHSVDILSAELTRLMKSNEDLRHYVDEIIERLRKVHET